MKKLIRSDRFREKVAQVAHSLEESMVGKHLGIEAGKIRQWKKQFGRHSGHLSKGAARKTLQLLKARIKLNEARDQVAKAKKAARNAAKKQKVRGGKKAPNAKRSGGSRISPRVKRRIAALVVRGQLSPEAVSAKLNIPTERILRFQQRFGKTLSESAWPAGKADEVIAGISKHLVGGAKKEGGTKAGKKKNKKA